MSDLEIQDKALETGETEVKAEEKVETEKIDEPEGVKTESKSDEGTTDTFSPFSEAEKGKTDAEGKKDEDLDDDDAKVIDSRVSAQTQGMQQEIDSLKAIGRVDEFLAKDGNDIYKPFAGKIKEYARDPRAKGMSVEAIARLGIDPRKMVEAGAERERSANKEANASRGAGGSSARAGGEAGELPDANSLSREEFFKVASKAGK